MHFIFYSATSLPIPVLRHEDEWRSSGATLSLNLTYFIPARPGDKLRITATTKSSGKRTVTVYGEVRSSMAHSSVERTFLTIHFSQIRGPMGLIASGTHIKMLLKVAGKMPFKQVSSI